MNQIDHNFKGAAIIHGDTLQVLKTFPTGLFGGIITDPPYASGAADQNGRQKSTAAKYSSAKTDSLLPDFEGDSKDQRSWTHWAAEWLAEARCWRLNWRATPLWGLNFPNITPLPRKNALMRKTACRPLRCA